MAKPMQIRPHDQSMSYQSRGEQYLAPVVQMSIRMPRIEYEQFRKLCKDERRTNGDMLSVLMKAYLKSSE